jgi:hypothetical protein
MTETKLNYEPTSYSCRACKNATDSEIKRLREALETIILNHPACFNDSDCPHNGGAGYDTGCFTCPCFLAERALKEREE